MPIRIAAWPLGIIQSCTTLHVAKNNMRCCDCREHRGQVKLLSCCVIGVFWSETTLRQRDRSEHRAFCHFPVFLSSSTLWGQRWYDMDEHGALSQEWYFPSQFRQIHYHQRIIYIYPHSGLPVWVCFGSSSSSKCRHWKAAGRDLDTEHISFQQKEMWWSFC